MQLKNKSILIVSQQDWGEMFISKHHYTLELAKRGNKVYYLNGPDQHGKMTPGSIDIQPTRHENAYIITHRLNFPYIFKFKVRKLYDYLLSFHIKKLLKQIGPVDIVWSFDLSDTIPLRLFPDAVKKIYMPVDELTQQAALTAAKSADIIFSVTYEILRKFHDFPVPKVFLNHGVDAIFLNKQVSENINSPIRVGLSGNFLRPDIDRGILLDIIKDNPDVIFDFWGSVDYATSNLSPTIQPDAVTFIDTLRLLPNVKLHGQLPPDKLAVQIAAVDCFLICYDINKDQSGGTNYHKILEYLATGKVVVSNNVTTYNNYPGMVEMITERKNNDALSALFKEVINNIGTYNSLPRQIERIQFAELFTYANQVNKIEKELQ